MPKAKSSKDKKGKEKKSSSNSLFWVGIGASAGGLEALKNFATNLPKKSRMTYIIVQHLSPNHKSMLVELINRETPLEVCEVEDGIKPQEGVIYITPSKHEIFVKSDRLFLKDSPQNIGPKPSINHFLSSLAEQKGEYAIGIILSGSGSDGAHGIRAVRAAGGITIAQNEETAKYFTMPDASIKTGCVDLVLSPDEIAKKLPTIIDIPRNKLALQEPKNDGDYLGRIFYQVKKCSGIDFSDYKAGTINRRIERRMVANAMHDISEYVELLHEDNNEAQLLFRDMLISVTSFFRDKESFGALRKYCEEIVEKSSDKPIRIWVPGCATGEEAYSIAIMFAEIMGITKFSDHKITIFATDVDETALDIARKGAYALELANELKPDILSKYFDQMQANYLVKKFIKSKVVYSQHNLISEPPFSKLNMISCRNLLIYFKNELQRKVVQIFHYSLLNEGILFLGKSESLGDLEDFYNTLDSSNRIFMKKPSRLGIPLPNYSSFNPVQMTDTTRAHAAMEKSNLQMLEKIVSSVAPHSILYDEKLNIRHIYGEIKNFMNVLTGVPHMNIMNIVEKQYAQDIHSLTYKCISKNIVAESIMRSVEINNEKCKLQIVVYPIFTENQFEKLFLACFNLQKDTGDSPVITADKKELSRMNELEDELATTKENLQTVVEELETSNEELQSLNEELQSANEELQSSNEELETSNEELQSTNEELTTVNDEIQVRSAELEKSLDQLENIKESVDLPIILVCEDLTITVCNELGKKIFADIDNPIHRNIATLPLEFEIDNLSSKIMQTIKTSDAHSEYITFKKSVYLLRITPYITSRNIVEGAVLVLVDQTEIKKTVKSLRDSNVRLENVLESLRDGIWEWPDIEKDEEYWSPRWKELLGYKEDEIEAKASTFFEMLHPDDREYTNKALQDHIKGKGQFDIEYRLKTKSGKYKWFRAKGIARKNPITNVVSMSGSLTDIDRYHNMEIALKESEITLDHFTESSYDGFWDWHIKDDYEYMSPKFWKMFGYDYKDKRHHPSEWQKIISEEGLKIASENLEKHVATKGKHPFLQEVEYKHKDGSSVYVICKGSVIEWDKDGNPIRMIGTHTNITKLKNIEKQLEQYNHSLQTHNEELEAFTFITSHDLKEPLRGLAHNAKVLMDNINTKDNDVAADSQKRIERIIYLCEKMDKLINDITRYATIDKQSLNIEEVDMNLVVEEVQEMMNFVLQESNTKIKIIGKLPKTNCDRICAMQVIKNLISNGVRYNSSKDKLIEVGIKSKKGNQSIFYVKDNGKGIDKKYHEEIFKLFRRLEKAEQNSTSGTGVGLTLVNKILKKHGGNIWVESKKNEGSTFYFTFGEANDSN